MVLVGRVLINSLRLLLFEGRYGRVWFDWVVLVGLIPVIEEMIPATFVNFTLEKEKVGLVVPRRVLLLLKLLFELGVWTWAPRGHHFGPIISCVDYKNE